MRRQSARIWLVGDYLVPGRRKLAERRLSTLARVRRQFSRNAGRRAAGPTTRQGEVRRTLCQPPPGSWLARQRARSGSVGPDYDPDQELHERL